jgi:hypothetical protein
MLKCLRCAAGLLAQVGFDVLQQSDSFVSRKAFADAPANLGMRLSVHGLIDRGDKEHGPHVGVFVVPESFFQLPHHVGGNVAHNRSITGIAHPAAWNMSFRAISTSVDNPLLYRMPKTAVRRVRR